MRQTDSSFHKNISYRPGQDRAKGFAKRVDEEKLRLILRSYSQRVTQSMSQLLAPYAGSWQLDFASYRPFEEQDRKLPLRARNDLLHVDSFPTRPTNGNRILRVFTNLHPTRLRVWTTTSTMETLARQFAQAAALSDIAVGNKSLLRRLGRTLGRAVRSVGIPYTDRSPYDRFMLRLHHYLKANRAFQENCAKSRWEFPPNSSWIVFTDMTPHAVLSGQFALEQTFIVFRDSMLLPHKAPVHILEQTCGLPLTN